VDPFVFKKHSPERINFLGQLLYGHFLFWQQKKQKKMNFFLGGFDPKIGPRYPFAF